MISVIVGIICFAVGYFVGTSNRKSKIIQVGGDNAYQVGIINNSTGDSDCANLSARQLN